jgi:hypothetical protein
MKSMDRPLAHSISADMMEALKAVALKHGVEFRNKGGSLSSTNVTFRIEAAVVGATGVAETRERSDFPRYCHMYNLKKEWLDATFNHMGTEYTITGLNTRKHKNPVLVKRNKDGKGFIFPDTTIKMIMEAKEIAAAVKA